MQLNFFIQKREIKKIIIVFFIYNYFYNIFFFLNFIASLTILNNFSIIQKVI